MPGWCNSKYLMSLAIPEAVLDDVHISDDEIKFFFMRLSPKNHPCTEDLAYTIWPLKNMFKYSKVTWSSHEITPM